MAWGAQDCGPDGFTPDGSPCVPDTNTNPCPQGRDPVTGACLPGDSGGGCEPGYSKNQGGICVDANGCPKGAVPGPSGVGCVQPGYKDPRDSFGGDGEGVDPFSSLKMPGKYSFDWGSLGPVPKFKAPPFVEPDAYSLSQDPGYQFRLQEGRRALESSAAARGVTRSGQTLTDILKYGQSLAAGEFGAHYNRKLEAHDRQFRGAQAEYAPLLFEYQTRAAGMQRGSELNFLKDWERYFFDKNLLFQQEQSLLNPGLA